MDSKIVFFWIVGLLLLNSCIVPKRVVYVKDMVTDSAYLAREAPALRLQKNDRLKIVVSASSMELAAPFNGGEGSYRMAGDGKVTSGSSAAGIMDGYMVDDAGMIDFPVLGKIQVEGLCLEDVREIVKSVLINNGYISNPTIKVELLNLKINVMGAVGSPTTLQVPEGRITLLEALTRVGGLKNTADPHAVFVIREEGGRRKKYINDVSSTSLFDSPTYYLQQNDIVYVEPRYAEPTPREQSNRQYITFGIGMLTFALSMFALFK